MLSVEGALPPRLFSVQFDGWRLTVRGYSLMGFLLGSTLAGAGVYYYVLEEYKVSNELLTEDIYVRCYVYLPFSLCSYCGEGWRWILRSRRS